jgi:hypothetical protein
MDAVSAGGRPLALGEAIAGATVGRVVGSDHPELRVGDAVEGSFGWQEYAVVAGRDLRKVEPGPAPLSAALGVLGLPGLTAYFGLLEAEPRRGETVVVSGATGAIGMVAGQVARLLGCRVVGLACGRADASWLRDELGFDVVLATEPAGDLDGALAEHCPGGVDVYLDTVGGATTDAVVRRINTGARICACGQSSQDNLERPEPGPRWLDRLIARRARVQGFLVSAHAERFAAGREQLGRWLAAGELGYREDVAEGIEAAPQAFIRLLGGESHGIQLVRTGPNGPRPP